MEEEYRDLLEKLIRLETLLHRYQGYRFRTFGPFANPHRGQGRVLSILERMSEISQKELAYLLDMRQQSLSELLQKLERSGFITRAPSQEDKRVYVITLTERGKEFSGHIGDTGEGGADDVFDCLSKEEQEKLKDYVDRLSDSLDRKLKAEYRDKRAAGGHGFGGHWRHGRHDFSFYWGTDAEGESWNRDRPSPHRYHSSYRDADPDRDAGPEAGADGPSDGKDS